MAKPWKAAALEMRARLADQRVTIAFTAPRPGGLHQRAYTLEAGVTRHIVLPEAIAGPAVGEMPLDVTLLRFETRIPGPRTDESSGALLARLGYDGVRWAAEMALHFPLDPAPGGHFHGWITNAIEAGITEGEHRERARRGRMEQPHLERALEDLAAEYGTLVVLRKLREMWPESWRAVKAVNIPLSEVQPMPADEAQAHHEGFTAAIRGTGQRIADAVAADLTGVVPTIADPMAAGIIGTMAYTSRQQQGEIDKLRREKAQLITITDRTVTERDNARTQLAQLTEAHQRVQAERDDALRQFDAATAVLDASKDDWDRLNRELAETTNTAQTFKAYADRYRAQRNEARRERDSAQATLTGVMNENARLSADLATALGTPVEVASQDKPLRDRVRPS